MANAPVTAESYPQAVLAADKQVEWIRQHNQGVRDDHAVTSTLDGDGATDADYESQLTTTEIRTEELGDPVESATAVAYTAAHLSEALMAEMVRQQNARVVDARAICDKLNADAGVADDDYAAAALEIQGLGEVPDAAHVYDAFPGGGGGVHADLLQALADQQAVLAQDWHDIAVKLDADAGLAQAYESQLAARVISEH